MTEAASRLIRSGSPQNCHPHERYLLRSTDWDALPDALRQEPGLELLGLWSEPGLVHAAFLKRIPEGGAPARLLLASAPLREGRFAALSPARPGAALFERAARDLWGAAAQGENGPAPAMPARGGGLSPRPLRGRPILAPGWIMAAGCSTGPWPPCRCAGRPRRRSRSSAPRRRARGCTSLPSAPCAPASPSPRICAWICWASAWRGWRRGWAMPTRARWG
ncbi:hypothetical protein MVG78_02190 [Roseomonas gilardii subsp. gilardii]|uniref:hypothetical protein n=1 Tax=Roseomonas gilardii TaxID=257708 RepID=UPI001FF95C9D|nr:hypothetical protein [Roseomonas gilardii]UPG73016.1 hypothetical protein MVG78_02190 [Roseomonas gilardii subsp. gilardii]